MAPTLHTAAASRLSRLARVVLAALLLPALLWAPVAVRAQGQASPAERVPMDLGPERPIETPPALDPKRSDPTAGIQFGLGFPYMNLRSDLLDTALELRGGSPTNTGVLLHVEVLWEPYRMGFARQLYRSELPSGTTLGGDAVDFLRYDADQVWLFHGGRPHHRLYLGYGLAVQRRVVRIQCLQVSCPLDPNYSEAETAFQAGLLGEWAVGPPYVLQLRVFSDLGDTLLVARGVSLQLGFTAAY